MNVKDPISSSEATALARFAAISKIQDYLRQGNPLAKALQWTAASPISDAQEHSRHYAYRTLETWWYAYQRDGLRALQPKARSDQGQPRRIPQDQQQWLLQQIQAHPAIPIKVLYRRWQDQGRSLPALNTLYRFLRQHQLDTKARTQLAKQPPTGPTKSFEVPFVNELWMVDFSPGPFLKPPGTKKAQPTHLCLILDDHSRLVPFGAYYPAANTLSFHQAFKEALRRRGLPRKLYTDQGAPFTNDHTKIVCANLGIRLLHAKPYHAWSKGKIERLFLTVQKSFEAALRLPGSGVDTLDELNVRFSHWLQNHYHTSRHSTTGQTPNDRFSQQGHLLRPLDAEQDLDRLFYHRLTRTVRKDGTVRLDNQLYEVDLALRGLAVQLRFDPATKVEIEVFYRDQRFGTARAVDRHLNSQLSGSRHYEKPNS